MRSLRIRIVAAIALVCAVTLFVVALYVGRTTLLVRVGPPPAAAMANVESAIAPFLRTPHSAARIRSELAVLGVQFGERIVIVNAKTQNMYWFFNPRPQVMMLRGGMPIVDRGRSTPWRLFVFPWPSPSYELAPVRRSILGSIWESALLGFAIALTVAIALGSYVVRPIRELTVAAQAMSNGDTARRVEVGADDEIGRLAGAFNTMADSIETTEGLRRRMITDVAHELRIPLTRMIAQLEAASDGHVSKEGALVGARDEAQRLERIVNDLRDLSLADAHELSIPTHDISVGTCIGDAIERAGKAGQAGVSLVRDVAADLPTALGDEFRVAQILDNLISNALRHTPAGGHVVVGARATADCVECFVQDDGAGIAREELPLIFERFYRADRSRSRTTGGSGLGLAIVKSLVDAQDGTIRVESVLGQGSRFSWTLRRSG